MCVRIILGEALTRLSELAADSFDAGITDPPYHLTANKKGGSGDASVNLASPYGRARVTTGFMNKTWDGGEIAFRPETWAAVLRVLKPGAHLVAFGGTRTHHRIWCAIEDGGFEIRDTIFWMYGSGFPKNHDAGNGRGTALKPACEPICLARKPLIGTVAQNIEAHGTGAINIDECRVPTDSAIDDARLGGAGAWKTDKAARNVYEGGYAGKIIASSPLGRWPANVIHDGSDEVLAAFPAEAGAAAPVTRRNADKFRNTYGAFKGDIDEKGSTFRGDAGSAARFFYCAKASRADRDEGLSGPDKPLLWSSGAKNPGSFQSDGTKKAAKNNHPTVKPTKLMRYLCRLVTPPGGTVLDPFAGSGSTGKAAILEGFGFLGIEREPEYVEIAEARLRAAQAQPKQGALL